MRACGCGLRRVDPHSIPSAHRSEENSNSPRTFAMPSGRAALSPTPSGVRRRVPVGAEVIGCSWTAGGGLRRRPPGPGRARPRSPACRPRRRSCPPTSEPRQRGRDPKTSAATGSSMPAWPSPSSRHSARSASLPASSEPSSSSRPRHRAPPMVPSASDSRAVSAAGPPRSRATYQRRRAVRRPGARPPARRRRRRRARPATPASSRSRTGAMPAPSRALEVGQCATPVPELGEPPIDRVVEVHAVGQPDVGAEPAEPFGVLHRGAAEAAPGSTPPRRRSRRGGCAGGRRSRGPASAASRISPG